MLHQGDWIGTFEGHKGAIWEVSINKDVTKIASRTADITDRVWKGYTGGEELKTI